MDPVYLALFKIISTIIDRLIDVLAVDVGDEALIERVCDEWAVPSWRGCNLAVYFPRLISIFFRHRFLGGLAIFGARNPHSRLLRLRRDSKRLAPRRLRQHGSLAPRRSRQHGWLAP
jgi:hypothetical protein